MSDGGARSYYLELVSGRARGAGAACLRGLLACGEVQYRAAMAARRAWYAVAARRVGLPVISVGNLTLGGTGKTPLVAWLARRLVELGRRPVIVSRGYKRVAGRVGDEAAALRLELPETVGQIETPDRVGALRSVVSEKKFDVAILDDGFQHLKLRRDLDLLLIDAMLPFGYGRLIPRGLLREPLSAIGRADAVILTRTDLVAAAELERIEAEVRRHLRPGAPLVRAAHVATHLVGMDGRREAVESLCGAAVYAYSGLANPDGFVGTLDGLGARVVGRRDFADHYHYTAADLADIMSAARAAQARVVTTTKDLVKVPAGVEGNVMALAVEMKFGGEEIERLVAEKLKIKNAK
jgi:tetraacyldisaccharide 4'-kinase